MRLLNHSQGGAVAPPIPEPTGVGARTLRLRADSPQLPAALPSLGAVRLQAVNGCCRLLCDTRFEEAWHLGADWVLATGQGSLMWPASCWSSVVAVPGYPARPTALHCFSRGARQRLSLLPRHDEGDRALEALVCRLLHPQQQTLVRPMPAPVMDPFAGAVAPAEQVAPEVMPSLFTLAWTRDLALNLEVPLAGAVWHSQQVPASPLWQGAQMRLVLGAMTLTLDCPRLGAVWRLRCRSAGREHWRILFTDDQGWPALVLGADDEYGWRGLLDDVLYSPLGDALSK
jgi:hypothetical protein